jgi:hypothetical protein
MLLIELKMEQYEALALFSFCTVQKEMGATVKLANTSLLSRHNGALIFTCADDATAIQLEQWLQSCHQNAHLYS